jgi:hypothetical protein
LYTADICGVAYIVTRAICLVGGHLEVDGGCKIAGESALIILVADLNYPFSAIQYSGSVYRRGNGIEMFLENGAKTFNIFRKTGHKTKILHSGSKMERTHCWLQGPDKQGKPF